MKKRTFTLALALLPLALAARAADDFPSHPIKLVYTYAAGGIGDALSRIVAEALGNVTGQSVVVENKTGANGSIGVMYAARLPADGYTVLLTTITTNVLVPYMTKDPATAPARILAPIANLAMQPLVLLVHASVPANDFPSFVEWARQQPGGVDFAVAGPTLEVSDALLSKDAGIKITNIFYRGGAPALQALLAGDVKTFFNPPSSSLLDYVRQGKVKVIGISSAEPTPTVPGGVPISKYLPGYVQDINFAMWVPAATPKEIRSKLEAAVQKAMATPGLGDKLAAMGMTLKHAGPDEVTRITERETASFKRAMEIAPIKFGE